MKRYRINKDITNRLRVKTNGDDTPLLGRDISLQLTDPKGQKSFEEFTITDGNVIVFVYYGKRHKYTGTYQLTVWENLDKTGMTAVDCINAFRLVPNTTLEGGEDPEGLDTEVNDLSLNLSTGISGADGVGIESVVQTTTSTEDGGINEITQTLTDGTTAVFQIRNGSKGSQGIQGERGLQGERGEKGEKGDAGEDWIPTQQELASIASSAAQLVQVPDDLADLNDDSTHRLVTDTEKTTWNGKQAQLVSGTNIKTINNESILGNGNITIQGSGSGDTNVIEVVKVNGTALTPDSNKAVDVPVPTALSGLTDDSTHRVVTDTEKSTWNSKAEIFIQDIDCSNLVDGEKIISGTTIYNAIDAAYRAGKQVWVRWTNGAQPLQPMIPLTMYDAQFGYAFGYNLINDNMQLCYMVSVTPGETVISWVQLRLYSTPSGGIPSSDLASAVQTSLGKADTALQSYTETDPTVPSWAKQSTKPTYTASEVGALPANTTIPSALADLSADSTHRVVTDTEKATWNAKGTYSKPSGGIPASDIASGVIPTVPTTVSSFTNDSHYVASTAITTIVSMTQAAYDALATKDANTLYIIPES